MARCVGAVGPGMGRWQLALVAGKTGRLAWYQALEPEEHYLEGVRYCILCTAVAMEVS